MSNLILKRHHQIILLWSVLWSILTQVCICTDASNLQAFHFLDPDDSVEVESKYYASWNSDKWIEWIRRKCDEGAKDRRFGDGKDKPLSHGIWVNTIIIASSNDLEAAFTAESNHSYPLDEERQDFHWSETTFPVYVVVRRWRKIDADSETKPHYKVFNCSQKKMYLNAKIDSTTQKVIAVKHVFPKQVKNPKETLRIPLTVCSEVGQTRSLLDEIKFQLRPAAATV